MPLYFLIVYETTIKLINLIYPNKSGSMFGAILIIFAMVFLILRFVKNESAERPIYAILSALFLFAGWYYYVFPLTSVTSTISANAITNSTVTSYHILVNSNGFILSLTLVIFYAIIMVLFMVRDVVILRSVSKP